MLGLDTESVMTRTRQTGGPVRIPNLKQALLVGTSGFTVVSVLMYGLWAVAGRFLHSHLGEVLFYAVLAVGFMACSGYAFRPILIGSQMLGRFYILFTASFLIYSIIWIGLYIPLRTTGEWLASLLAPAMMTFCFCLTFNALNRLAQCTLAMVAGHTVGYFLGSWLFSLEALRSQTGMLLWGVTYGAGFGFGISYTLYWCQHRTREQILELVESAAMEPPEKDKNGSD